MQQWFFYALIAAIFIGIKDMITKDIANKYTYIQYILIANLLVFIFTVLYILTMRPKIQTPNLRDGFYILMRIAIVWLIVEPCIFLALKHCKNPGYAKSIINLNTVVAFVFGLFVLKNDFEWKNVLGLILIVGGTLMIY
tara:strand:- start:365 stop:781 length:417 start_codon:yes stop_codon:yes gene_type:complete